MLCYAMLCWVFFTDFPLNRAIGESAKPLLMAVQPQMLLQVLSSVLINDTGSHMEGHFGVMTDSLVSCMTAFFHTCKSPN